MELTFGVHQKSTAARSQCMLQIPTLQQSLRPLVVTGSIQQWSGENVVGDQRNVNLGLDKRS